MALTLCFKLSFLH